MIDSFSGEYDFLSNFYEREILYNGVKYKTTEHAFQAAKAINQEDHDLIMNSSTPGKSKKLGRTIKIKNNWDNIKNQIMYEIVSAKFNQHQDLMNLLLKTRDEELIEGNWWKDTYWGVCNGVGTNYLGKILMKIRSGVKLF